MVRMFRRWQVRRLATRLLRDMIEAGAFNDNQCPARVLQHRMAVAATSCRLAAMEILR